jgi:hypothetical protein
MAVSARGLSNNTCRGLYLIGKCGGERIHGEVLHRRYFHMSRTPYNGASRKLVLAFDIGTTYSGAAYAFLDPGEVPQINMVTK